MVPLRMSMVMPAPLMGRLLQVMTQPKKVVGKTAGRVPLRAGSPRPQKLHKKVPDRGCNFHYVNQLAAFRGM